MNCKGCKMKESIPSIILYTHHLCYQSKAHANFQGQLIIDQEVILPTQLRIHIHYDTNHYTIRHIAPQYTSIHSFDPLQHLMFSVLIKPICTHYQDTILHIHCTVYPAETIREGVKHPSSPRNNPIPSKKLRKVPLSRATLTTNN